MSGAQEYARRFTPLSRGSLAVSNFELKLKSYKIAKKCVFR